VALLPGLDAGQMRHADRAAASPVLEAAALDSLS